jgi:hypothetical protein
MVASMPIRILATMVTFVFIAFSLFFAANNGAEARAAMAAIGPNFVEASLKTVGR